MGCDISDVTAVAVFFWNYAVRYSQEPYETTAVMSCCLAHESRSNTACHRFNSHVTAVAVVDSVPVVSVTCCGQCLAWADCVRAAAVAEPEKTKQLLREKSN